MTISNGYGGLSGDGFKMYDGMWLKQNGFVGVLRKAGTIKAGGGHGEGTWHNPNWILVSTNLRVQLLEKGEVQIVLPGVGS